MSNPLDSVQKKVEAIFRDAFGEQAERLDGSRLAEPARTTVTEALVGELVLEKARKIALHMTDWNGEAAFIVALHLFPVRFTPEEIDAGIGKFLCHAPNHIRAACQLTQHYVWENFPEDDEGINQQA